MKYFLPLLGLFLTACSDSECIESHKVVKILGKEGPNVIVQLDDGSTRISRNNSIQLDRDLCFKWKEKE